MSDALGYGYPTEPHPIAIAFRTAFLRGLEQWTFSLRGQPGREPTLYAIAGCRNEYNASSGLGLNWEKP